MPVVGAMLCLHAGGDPADGAVRGPGTAANGRAHGHPRERRAYYGRTAAIGACCTVAAVLLQGHGSWWLTRIILLLEVAADLSCFWMARRKITAAKNAGDWFAGLRQTVVADTNWRTDPPRFPVLLADAGLAVAATAVVGAVRYPDLPAHLERGVRHSRPG